MNDTKLKPCPFCGGLNLDDTCREQEQTGARRQYFYVYCNLCQACGPTDFRQDDAIEQWNLRASPYHDEGGRG